MTDTARIEDAIRICAACMGVTARTEDAHHCPAGTPTRGGAMSETWLDMDEPPTARCSTCHRQTWDADSVGASCGMPQPDGSACGGTFIPRTPTEAYVEERARAEAAEAEVGHLRGRFEQMLQTYRDHFTEGEPLEEWHRKHCGAAEAAAREHRYAEAAEAEVERLIRNPLHVLEHWTIGWYDAQGNAHWIDPRDVIFAKPGPSDDQL